MKYRPGTIGIVIDDFSINLAERAIEFFSGDAMHVFAYHGNGKITEALVWEGVVVGTIDKYYDGKSSVLMCEPIEDVFTDAIIPHIIKRWEKDVGKPYDKGNILSKITLSNRWNSDKRRICSEHVAYGYEVCFKFWGLDKAKVTPHHIYKLMYSTNGNYFNCKPLTFRKKK